MLVSFDLAVIWKIWDGQVQDAEQRSVQWEETLQRRQAAAKEAGQAAAEQLQADARELQDCCMRLEAWLTANRQEVAAQDSLADALSGKHHSTSWCQPRE